MWSQYWPSSWSNYFFLNNAEYGFRLQTINIAFQKPNRFTVPNTKRTSIFFFLGWEQGLFIQQAAFSRMDRFSAFCDSTSLHGWPHIPGSSTMGKIFWAITILAMAAVAIYLCSRFPTKVTKVTKVNITHQHGEAVHNVNSVNEPGLLYRTDRTCHFPQSCRLQQIPTQVWNAFSSWKENLSI